MAKRSQQLSSASAYWRLAGKAARAGNYRQAERYRQLGDQKYQQYQRQQEYLQRVAKMKDISR